MNSDTTPATVAPEIQTLILTLILDYGTASFKCGVYQGYNVDTCRDYRNTREAAFNALCAALAAQVAPAAADPVAWIRPSQLENLRTEGFCVDHLTAKQRDDRVPLYLATPVAATEPAAPATTLLVTLGRALLNHCDDKALEHRRAAHPMNDKFGDHPERLQIADAIADEYKKMSRVIHEESDRIARAALARPAAVDGGQDEGNNAPLPFTSDTGLVKAGSVDGGQETPAPAATDDVFQIALALQRHGLTLLKTASGYDVRRLGPIIAQAPESDLSHIRRAADGGDAVFGAEVLRARDQARRGETEGLDAKHAEPGPAGTRTEQPRPQETPGQPADLRALLEFWSCDGRLQTFADRERFREECRAALASVHPAEAAAHAELERLAIALEDIPTVYLAAQHLRTDTPVPSGSGAAGEKPEAVDVLAVRDVLAERQRQIEVEGWTPEHDDEHQDGAMAVAAACYAMHSGIAAAIDSGNIERFANKVAPFDRFVPMYWPWDAVWWKPSGARRNLVRAAALLLAEIERLDRAAAKHAARPPFPCLRCTSPEYCKCLQGCDISESLEAGIEPIASQSTLPEAPKEPT